MSEQKIIYPKTEITKREILVSIFFLAILWTIGVLAGNKIDECVFDNNEKYLKAVEITKPSEFKYALKTNIGHLLAYGELKSVGTVSDDHAKGYMMIERRKELRRPHTRTIREKCGDRTCSRKETSYSWEEVGREKQSVTSVKFLDYEFNLSQFPVPEPHFLDTYEVGFDARYQYYVIDSLYTGTLYTNAHDNMLSNMKFKEKLNISETKEDYVVTSEYKIMFWAPFIAFLVVLTYGFYFFENKWLYTHKKK
ncbi:MAG: hypothetical protein MJY87_00655 [Fibrobacter sp.]|nr:hypothetical protein [Fibrobacter sp.]